MEAHPALGNRLALFPEAKTSGSQLQTCTFTTLLPCAILYLPSDYFALLDGHPPMAQTRPPDCCPMSTDPNMSVMNGAFGS